MQTCNVFKLISYLASDQVIEKLAIDYKNGNIGYGHAKQQLNQEFLNYFDKSRKKFDELMTNKDQLMQEMKTSLDDVRSIAKNNLLKIKHSLGIHY